MVDWFIPLLAHSIRYITSCLISILLIFSCYFPNKVILLATALAFVENLKTANVIERSEADLNRFNYSKCYQNWKLMHLKVCHKHTADTTENE